MANVDFSNISRFTASHECDTLKDYTTRLPTKCSINRKVIFYCGLQKSNLKRTYTSILIVYHADQSMPWPIQFCQKLFLRLSTRLEWLFCWWNNNLQHDKAQLFNPLTTRDLHFTTWNLFTASATTIPITLVKWISVASTTRLLRRFKIWLPTHVDVSNASRQQSLDKYMRRTNRSRHGKLQTTKITTCWELD